MRAHRIEALRVERQDVLQAQKRVKQHEARRVERQQGQRIAEPILLAPGIDACQRIEALLEWTEGAIKESRPPLEHASHVDAERPGGGDHQREHQPNLKPAVEGHAVTSLCAARGAAAVGRRDNHSFSGWRSAYAR